MAKVTNEGNSLSPATLLNHEFDHANQFDKNTYQFIKDSETRDDQFGNCEDERVITGSEQDTAKKHGDIQEGDVTRKDHGVAGYTPVSDPTSNGAKSGIQAKKQNKSEKEDEKNK